MPTIDADAHVIETERTWDYMDEADSKFRPIVVSSHARYPISAQAHG